MSFDWTKRHNSVGQHFHLAKQILNEDTGAEDAGGGSLTVTDGTTSVAATTLHMANASVADGGGGTAVATPLNPLSWDPTGAVFDAPQGMTVKGPGHPADYDNIFVVANADNSDVFTVDSSGTVAVALLDDGSGHGGTFAVETGTITFHINRLGASSAEVILSGLPTADPHVAGALYTVAGVLHVSAG